MAVVVGVTDGVVVLCGGGYGNGCDDGGGSI